MELLLAIGKKLLSLSVVVVLLVGVSFHPSQASAAQLALRSLQIGDATPGAITRHTFTFSYVTTSTNVGSISFEYCTSPILQIACDTPSGLDVSGAVLAEQTGEVGFTVTDAQPGKLTLGRAAAALPANNPSTYAFDNVVNPGDPPDTFYVRITTYESLDGSGTYTDFGAVVNSTTQGVQVSSEVPPYLKFCVGLSIDNDCSTAEGNLIDLGDLSTNTASTGSSQMMAATNAPIGLAIAAYGTTMTSGNNVIPALDTPTVSAPGNAQFGLNLRANTNPPVGQEPSGGGIAVPAARYDIPNRFTFASGDTVATSPDATDTRKFTASYIANISPSQPPGVYTATLTYICTATF